jgi:hypothetical protein
MNRRTVPFGTVERPSNAGLRLMICLCRQGRKNEGKWARKETTSSLEDVSKRRQIAEQKEFVGWWDETISKNQGPGRGKTNADRGSFSAAQAEDELKIKHQQVSRWRKGLKVPDLGLSMVLTNFSKMVKT